MVGVAAAVVRVVDVETKNRNRKKDTFLMVMGRSSLLALLL